MVREANYVMIMEVVKGEKEWHGGVYWYSPASSYPWQHGHLQDNKKYVLSPLVLEYFFLFVSGLRVQDKRNAMKKNIEKIYKRIYVPCFAHDYNIGKEDGCFWSGERWTNWCFWRRFGLRRADGVLLVKCLFRHTQRLTCKWE
ncbi:unnamed protein product [Brassica oleracea]